MARKRNYVLVFETDGQNPVSASLYKSAERWCDDLVATEEFSPFDGLSELYRWLVLELRLDIRRQGG